ncbi:hypothetical protein EDB80DRAFT_736825 [Ilyonectria destructans]|nr:hypothetical protein EDB80DRAFT_736825 [Ilyonectria destructans]
MTPFPIHILISTGTVDSRADLVRRTQRLFVLLKRSRQTASRVDSDGLRPEFRRSPSLRLNKTGRRGPIARAEVEECCAVRRDT